jgi:hypothetical protein
MANAVDKVNGIAIGDIQAINGVTDDNLQALNALEFTGAPPDAMTLLGTVTGADVTSISVNDSTLTTGISSTYDMYIFEVINAHSHGSEGVQQNLQFAVNHTDTADYNDVLIDAGFGLMYHDENDSSAGGFTSVDGDRNTVQVAGYANLTSYEGNTSDESSNGQIIFWGLGSTSYEKQFISQFSIQAGGGDDMGVMTEVRGNIQGVTGGSGNTVAAVDDINFKFSAGGNISATIKVWGMAKS